MDAPATTFAGRISDAELTISNAGFHTGLWIPEFGWDNVTEIHAAEDPFLPQLLAAQQIFIAFFLRPIARVWVHLAAEMQAGKTGVVTTLIRLVLKNVDRLSIRPTNIFVLTGMNDNAWRKQTRDRLPKGIRANVYHNSGLTKFARAITGLARGGELSNVMVVIDESHLASSVTNRPKNLIYDQVVRLCPEEKWQENNIRFLTISATDPAKVMILRHEPTAQVIHLLTTEYYQSVRTLNAARRIRWLETFGDLHNEKALRELHRCITEEYSDRPFYHIIRPRANKQMAVIAALERMFPTAHVLPFDSEENSRRRTGARGEEASVSSDGDIKDINSILCDAPEKHTFVVLKNMLYAAKTLDDTHVGVLWDRMGGKDDTNLQSLLGRACGYGKSKRTVVYASRGTVENYEGFWRELCSGERIDPVLQGIPIKKVDKKMAGVVARGAAGGGTGLYAAASASAPLSGGTGETADGGRPAPPPLLTRKKANDKDFEHSFTEYETMEAARFRNMRTPNKDEDGFYLTSTTGSPTRQPLAAVLATCNGKPTANLAWGKLEIGQSTRRLYVGYRDISDPTTAVFIVRTLTRVNNTGGVHESPTLDTIAANPMMADEMLL
jgi:hypothetical protein